MRGRQQARVTTGFKVHASGGCRGTHEVQHSPTASTTYTLTYTYTHPLWEQGDKIGTLDAAEQQPPRRASH